MKKRTKTTLVFLAFLLGVCSVSFCEPNWKFGETGSIKGFWLNFSENQKKTRPTIAMFDHPDQGTILGVYGKNSNNVSCDIAFGVDPQGEVILQVYGSDGTPHIYSGDQIIRVFEEVLDSDRN